MQHIQILNFNLKGINHDDFIEIADTMAPVFAEVPGLLSKIWLADQESNTYGGVYTWKDRQAMETFSESSLFNDVASNPILPTSHRKISANFFQKLGILEGTSKITGM